MQTGTDAQGNPIMRPVGINPDSAAKAAEAARLAAAAKDAADRAAAIVKGVGDHLPSIIDPTLPPPPVPPVPPPHFNTDQIDLTTDSGGGGMGLLAALGAALAIAARS